MIVLFHEMLRCWCSNPLLSFPHKMVWCTYIMTSHFVMSHLDRGCDARFLISFFFLWKGDEERYATILQRTRCWTVRANDNIPKRQCDFVPCHQLSKAWFQNMMVSVSDILRRQNRLQAQHDRTLGRKWTRWTRVLLTKCQCICYVIVDE